MALSATELIDEIAVILGTGARSGDNLRTSILRWINQGCRNIAYAYPWDERRRSQRTQLIAPYNTGTATFTNGSAVVTGSGTTWAAGFVGRKISRALGQPYYRILSRQSDTQVTLTEAYSEATATAVGYTIFQDEYDLAATTHSVEAADLIKDRLLGEIRGFEQGELDAADFVGTTSGRPVGWCVTTSTTVGTPRIRLIPVPDDTYRIDWRYLITWTDLLSDNSVSYTASLPVDVEELILDRALRWAPKIEGSRAVMSDDAFRKALRLVWANHTKRRYRIGHRRGIGRSWPYPTILVSPTGLIA